MCTLLYIIVYSICTPPACTLWPPTPWPADVLEYLHILAIDKGECWSKSIGMCRTKFLSSRIPDMFFCSVLYICSTYMKQILICSSIPSSHARVVLYNTVCNILLVPFYRKCRKMFCLGTCTHCFCSLLYIYYLVLFLMIYFGSVLWRCATHTLLSFRETV